LFPLIAARDALKANLDDADHVQLSITNRVYQARFKIMSKTLRLNVLDITNDVLDHVHLSARMFEFATKASSSAFTNTAAQKVVGTPHTTTHPPSVLQRCANRINEPLTTMQAQVEPLYQIPKAVGVADHPGTLEMR
jgi:hypothetical protein